MNQEEKEKIARNAASGWCRCFKCDGVINETHLNCDKDKLITCLQWYDGYRTAMIALGDYEHIKEEAKSHSSSKMKVLGLHKRTNYKR